MIRIAICEDEVSQQIQIKQFLDKILNNIEYEILMFNCGEELINNYPKDIDIFLLDIQMDKINGMDVARNIRKIDKNSVEIIFTTSVVEYIQEGYEVRAYRYLLKPIKFEELKKHILACIEEIQNKKDQYLIIEGKGEIYKIDINNITYVEVQKKDMIVHTVERDYEVKMSLEKIEKELSNYKFFRCHKSFLVNLNYIENIKQYIAILENGAEVSVSRHRFKEFKAEFLNILGEVI
ncbi:LytTR family DNA-binding domain-containing protein [Romboutsia sedimentorum]|uniref:Stage 0 sporulation protein A homolog n=1 Tax=Romboutsia sedimentorum TaxID=1368474 RepID=A0ABT7E7M4_9FIRM|nr:LytTR family DNA-binding domain-containing protein [Romboutsia sedimentorum]MDK2562918.1 LytTR family DNA-binding domain-containing protein [Romboutsia sedimentorum]